MKYLILIIVLLAWVVYYFQVRKTAKVSIPVLSGLAIGSLLLFGIAFSLKSKPQFIGNAASMNAAVGHTLANELANQQPGGGNLAVLFMDATSDSWDNICQESYNGIEEALLGKGWTIERIDVKPGELNNSLNNLENPEAAIGESGYDAVISFVGPPQRKQNDGIKFAACVAEIADNPASWNQKLRTGQLHAVARKKNRSETSKFSKKDSLDTIFTSRYELITSERR